MNRLVSTLGAAVVTVTVFLFALFLIIDLPFGYFLVCLLLPVGFIMMTAGFYNETEDDRRAPALVGVILSAVYGVLAFLHFYKDQIKD